MTPDNPDAVSATPAVSVVIPTYNRARLLPEAIRSVARQTFEDFEIIVVDDGSTDNTAEVVEALNLPRLRYIRCRENSGANRARNIGIESARGTYVSFQDSDDEWAPQKLAKQVAMARELDADIVFCAFNRVDDGGSTRVPKPGYGIRPGLHNLHQQLLLGSFISCQTLMVRRRLLVEVGLFDESLPRLQDWELCLRLSREHPIGFLEEPLVTATLQGDSTTRDFEKYREAVELILARHADSFADNRAARAILYFNSAAMAFGLGRYALGLRNIASAMISGGLQTPRAAAIMAARR